MCGGGSGGGSKSIGNKKYWGGGGAAFKGLIYITKGIISITVGTAGGTYGGSGGNSLLNNMIICGGGIGRRSSEGTGGTLTMNISPISAQIQSNGVVGPGSSLLGNGYGLAGYNNGAGTSGYVKIIYKRLK